MTGYATYPYSLGLLEVGYDRDAITHLQIVSASSHEHRPTALTDLAAEQIQQYLSGQRRTFDFPAASKGSAFQMSVWEALRQIPYGQTRSYGQIASAIGKSGAARAVGQACNRNPLWLIVPCHRVVGKNGALTGFEGGVELKQALLNLEQSHK